MIRFLALILLVGLTLLTTLPAAHAEPVEPLSETELQMLERAESIDEMAETPSLVPEAPPTLHRVVVIAIRDEKILIDDEAPQIIQHLTVQPETRQGTPPRGPMTLERQLWSRQSDQQEALVVGDTIVVAETAPGQYQFHDHYRLPQLALLLGLFLVMVTLGARLRGITAALGLAVSLLVIFQGIAPALIGGASPLLVFPIGAALIATFTLYLAHGFSRRTTVAWVATLISLLLAVAIGWFSIRLLGISGADGEVGMFADHGVLKHIDLRGLFLGATLLGALGVLDDVTTAQAAVAEELHLANPELDAKALFTRGMSVGREHIVSMVNTLAMAYVSASFPMLLIAIHDGELPWWGILNSAFITEEIIRTLTGSMALALATPLTALIAAWTFAPRQSVETA
ncbi:MAG: YibE/F family protein [Magnetococcales bacterium]|nr:YibE/F family protein [Magnetococcales bacterium]